jgi:hypothetical protein
MRFRIQNTVFFLLDNVLISHGFTYLQVLSFPQQKPDLWEAGSADSGTEFWLCYRTAQSRYIKFIFFY